LDGSCDSSCSGAGWGTQGAARPEDVQYLVEPDQRKAERLEGHRINVNVIKSTINKV
jgi:hypothetical protein